MNFFRQSTIMAFLFMAAPLLFAIPAVASEPKPVILRAAVKPEAEIWVGQRVELQLDLLAKDGWGQIKKIGDFQVPGAFVVRLQSQGTRLNETVSGGQYGGQRYEISLFPQQSGRISVPSISLDVEIRRWGPQGENQTRQMTTSAVTFEARSPPGTEGFHGLISTTELAAQQKWAPQGQEFDLGDAIKRTIELSAPDISGMAFVPLQFPVVDGLGIYAGEPAVYDSYVRGSLTGKRIESVTYVFQKQGAFELPAIEIIWWDIGRKQLKTALLPSLTVSIKAATGSGAGTAAEQAEPGKTSHSGLIVVLLLAVLTISAWWSRITIRSRWQRWRHERQETERAKFRRFGDACRQNDAKAAYQHLVDWLGHPKSDPEAVTLKALLEAVDSNKLTGEVTKLERRLFGNNGGRDARAYWDGRGLYNELTRLRNKFAKTKSGKPSQESLLAPLNPQ